jgi:N-acyl-D-amino-acid deacylase
MPRRILLRGASICDGTGAPNRTGDLLIEDDRIAELDEVSLPPDEVIDGSGLTVAPGFIDIHSHGDFSLPRDPLASAKILQGVTTEVVGNCGLGLYPSNAAVDAMYKRLAPMVFGEASGECSASLSAYRARLEEGGISVNAAPLLAHGNVRGMALGMAERAPTAPELEAMREIVAASMAQGAFGLSTGLVYAPGAYAQTDELVELAKVAGAHGGFYASHLRNEGARLEESVAEAIAIGERAGLPVQISHHKAVGKFNWGKVTATLAMVDEANRRGGDVHSDVYPYTAGAAVIATMFLPLWAFEGSLDDTLRRLGDPLIREGMIRDAKAQLLAQVELPKWLAALPRRVVLPMILQAMGKAVILSSVKGHRAYEGQSIAAIARLRKKDLYEAMYDLLREEHAEVTAIAHLISEDDVRAVLRHPRTMIGTDGFALREGRSHPRTFGTYPRVLERYVREEGLLSLEEAVHRMTGLVAGKLGLPDRGVLASGNVADLVVFDAAGVHDRATYDDPNQSPAGIRHVFVGGRWTVRDGAHTGERAGKVLARVRGPKAKTPAAKA